MEDFIPYNKLSKKEKKKRDKLKRNDWDEINPVTKVIENKKRYKRKEKYPKKFLEEQEREQELQEEEIY